MDRIAKRGGTGNIRTSRIAGGGGGATRDLFDIKQLYENEGLTDDLFRVFLVYLASSGRPLHELLNPNLRDLEIVFTKEFDGMTTLPVTVSELDVARDYLIQDIKRRLSGQAAHFLAGLANGEPSFSAIGLPEASKLPSIRWKLQNIAALKQQNPAKHSEQLAALEQLLSRTVTQYIEAADTTRTKGFSIV